MPRTGNKTPLSSDEIVEQHFPLYGPYDRDTTVRAGFTMAELTRYLNYATAEADGLPFPVALYDLIGALNVVAQRLPQALEQSGQRLGQLAELPEFVNRSMDYLAEPETAHANAVEVAAQARAELQRAAGLARGLADQLATVQTVISPLGMNIAFDDDEDED